MKLSLEQEKYLCMLNRLDAFKLIKFEQSNATNNAMFALITNGALISL